MGRKVASGLLHLDADRLKVLREVEQVVREEGERSGGANRNFNAYGTGLPILWRRIEVAGKITVLDYCGLKTVHMTWTSFVLARPRRSFIAELGACNEIS